MRIQNEVYYLGKPAYIVGIRQPNLWRGEHGKYYDLSRKPKEAKPDYRNIPERYLKPAPAPEPEINEVCAVVAEHNRLALVRNNA